MKKIVGVYTAPRPHWVGDGFPVRSLFSYNSHGATLSPFLLMDYAGPQDFPAGNQHPRGVGVHPHRGFETVTIVYKGEVSHRDSTGKGGTIGPGDVQWMTAASGILHEEFHSEAFSKAGGTLEMVQLWVNLPAKDKKADPGYQSIRNQDIPSVPLPDGAGAVRVIAGDYAGTAGPARTFTPMNVWDVALRPGASVELPAPDGWTTAVIVLHGTVQVNGDAVAREAEMVLLQPDGAGLTLDANNDTKLLILSGEPIREPIAGQGPFVLNTQEELYQAFEDFRSGKFGSIPA